MLNELHELDRAMASGGVAIGVRHPDIKPVSSPAGVLRVRLDTGGGVEAVQWLDREHAAKLWTIRDGQHNSFPYHQLKPPLLNVAPEDPRLALIRSARQDEGVRVDALRSLLSESGLDPEQFGSWPPGGWLRRLHERRQQFARLCDGDAEAVPALYDRFFKATEDPERLLRGLLEKLRESVENGAGSIPIGMLAIVLLDGKAPLYFEVSEFDFDSDAGDPEHIDAISAAVSGAPDQVAVGRCVVSGAGEALIDDKFPQPNVPILGQTYLFAKNRDAPTNVRYGRVGPDGISVGRTTAERLQGALESITRTEWKDRTWRGIPGERPKETDLFLAYVPAEPGAEIAGPLAEEPPVDPVAGVEFSALAQRLTEALAGRVVSRRDEPLSLIVLRKLDPANRKVVYSATTTVGVLLDSAVRWSEACRNVPPGIALPLPGRRGEKAHTRPPREIPPLALVNFSRKQFIRGGTGQQDVVGITAMDAMRVFFAESAAVARPGRALLKRVLRQRGVLMEAVAHARTRGLDDLKAYDRLATLDTVTVLAMLLHKLGRTRETYMSETAFKLGQLLAAADVLHAGYNASERGGSGLPPRLIGNATLQMAQSDPTRALAVLCRRWSVYQGWASRNAAFRVSEQAADGATEDARRDRDRAWAIRRGISAAWRAKDIAADLHGKLPPRGVGDEFRAELLLGYIAGLPRPERDESQQHDTAETTTQGE